MKIHLTISEMMKKLRIRPSDYGRFKHWCFKHKDQLDIQLCKWNHGYLLYNVKLVSELYPNTEYYQRKHAAPSTTPLEAAEMLGKAISKETGGKVTGTEVLAAFERGKDYIRMRRTMARVLWRMRKARRIARIFSRNAVSYSNHCCSAKIAAESAADSCKNYSKSCKVTADFISEYHTRAFDVSRNAEKAARMMNVIMFTIFVICAITIGTVYEIVN